MNQVIQQALKDFDSSIVHINESIIEKVHFSKDERNILNNSINPYFYDKTLFESVSFILTFNSINYQFWELYNNEFIRYSHNNSIGALAAFDGFINLYEELKPLNFDTNHVNDNFLRNHLGNIPSISSRSEILKESFNLDTLSKIYKLIDNSITNNNKINTELAFTISQYLPQSYSEPYLKKIQLALYEIGKVYENKSNINIQYDITVAADYQIPKVLFGLNILNYNSELKYKIDNYILIPTNSVEERAIRAATILSCEQISKFHNIDIPTLDKLLWLHRNKVGKFPFHLTFTTYY